MAVKIKLEKVGSDTEFNFIADLDNELKYRDVFEYGGETFVVSNNPTNHLNLVNGVRVIETQFTAVKLL
jgi:hypothetical protein